MARRQSRTAVPAPVRIGLPVLLCVSATAVGLSFLVETTLPTWGWQGFAIVGVCWAVQLWYLRWLITTTPATEQTWGHLLGAANLITVIRGVLYAIVAGFIVVPPTATLVWLPALCYGAGVALDGIDGTVARTVGKQTTLGKRLDIAFDSFGFVAAPLVAVLWGQLPVWYLSLSVARYAFLGSLYWRQYRGRPVFDRPDNEIGRYLAGIQMLFVTAALLPVMPPALIWGVAPVVLAPSLAVFARDFLVVSGRLPVGRSKQPTG